MQTRSKVRARSGEFDRSPIRNQANVASESDIATDDEIIRCDECDEDINPDQSILIENVWFCLKCARSTGQVTDADVSQNPKRISQTRRVTDLRGRSPKSSGDVSNNKLTAVIITVLIAVISVGGYFIIPSQYLSTLFTFSQLHSDEFDCTNVTFLVDYLESFNENFPSQLEDTWVMFAAGIHRIYTKKPTEPTSFLLFHKDGDETANCLAKKISKVASKCLTGTSDVIDVSSKDLREEVSKDSGELITRYNNTIVKKNVMLVRDINELPGKVVKEFHYFCDTHQPLVHKAIYFFTMSTDDNITDGRKVLYKVEKSFKKEWGTSLDYNVLDPLITRMTANVIPVISEERYKLNGC